MLVAMLMRVGMKDVDEMMIRMKVGRTSHTLELRGARRIYIYIYLYVCSCVSGQRSV